MVLVDEQLSSRDIRERVNILISYLHGREALTDQPSPYGLVSTLDRVLEGIPDEPLVEDIRRLRQDVSTSDDGGGSAINAYGVFLALHALKRKYRF